MAMRCGFLVKKGEINGKGPGSKKHDADTVGDEKDKVLNKTTATTNVESAPSDALQY